MNAVSLATLELVQGTAVLCGMRHGEGVELSSPHYSPAYLDAFREYDLDDEGTRREVSSIIATPTAPHAFKARASNCCRCCSRASERARGCCTRWGSIVHAWPGTWTR